jgi:toxin-antitoxin system PIN domain toxin
MIAVDTNLLVYAHREDSDFHESALSALLGLAQGSRAWGIPWPCLHEFIAIVTHPSIYRPPTDIATVLAAIRVWIESPLCRMIGEGPAYFERLEKLVLHGKVRGPMIHDARVAAICLHNGVTELWSADRDFSRFGTLRVVNPLVGK